MKLIIFCFQYAQSVVCARIRFQMTHYKFHIKTSRKEKNFILILFNKNHF